jgi:two-component system chemotaxis sensor kinase CheA
MANRKDEIKARLLATFGAEAQEHLQGITANLLALDRGLPPEQAREVVEATFREVHTLKGAARSVSVMNVETLCQAWESLLSKITRGRLALSRPILDLLQEVNDGAARLLAGSTDSAMMTELVGRLERTATTQVVEARTRPSRSAPIRRAERLSQPVTAGPILPDTVRLDVTRLDALLFQAEELLGPKLAAEERVHEAKALFEALTDYHAATPDSQKTFRALEVRARELVRHLVRDQRTVAGTVDGVLDELRQLRMMPASSVLDVFPGMIRDLANEHGKDVGWMVHGGDLKVDRKVLEAIKDPLIHLVRNAIDHGIEPAEARSQAGKPPRGRVAVTITSPESGRIEVCVEDDGRGIDTADVRATAARTRLLTAEAAEALTDDQALDLIYRSGFSTSSLITDVSGHGLGMAIVKERVERLGGRVSLDTRPGQGTTVRMTLPASITTFFGLLVRSAGQLLLLPLDAVVRVIRIAPEEVERIEGRDVVRWDGRPLPVARLSGLLGLPNADDTLQPGGKQMCVIIRSGEEKVGLLLEEILGDQEALVKELRPPLIRVRNVAAAGLLGTGQAVLILRPVDLIASFRTSPRQPAVGAAPTTAPTQEARQPAILVVDDSITTRTMEQNLLEASGYRVRVAVDGVEAWTLLKSADFDLVVSDVDMPRMDGFELTARIRADRKLADLPVVLVTALEAREDKERGIEVGANAYIIKSSFDQSNLLEIIRRLI